MTEIKSILVWNNRFCIDEGEIDKHHQELFELTNKIGAYVGQKNVSKLEVSASIGLLVNYATSHFEEEERMLLERGYPLFHTHCDEHRSFCTIVAEAAIDLVQDRLDIKDMSDFLNDWLTNHILVSDMAYKQYFERAAAREKNTEFV